MGLLDHQIWDLSIRFEPHHLSCFFVAHGVVTLPLTPNVMRIAGPLYALYSYSVLLFSDTPHSW
jgi:hypothetical protein